MNIRPLHDETTLPIPLLTVQHQRAFANTEAAVREHCSACQGACPTPEACELSVAQATKPPRAPFWLLRVITRARLAIAQWHLQCLRDERDYYVGLGMVGDRYMRNSWAEEERLLKLIRSLTT